MDEHTSLGERILAAARLAMTLHLQAEFKRLHQDSSRQQVMTGGAGPDLITDDALPEPPSPQGLGSAEREAA